MTEAEAVPPSGSPPGPDLVRSTLAMTGLTMVSRLTGLVRVLVVAAVLGTTFLGNTFQSANTVPNLLFELLAAGVLQAVMIPTLVTLFDGDDGAGAEHVAGALLGLALTVLAVVAALGMLAAPWLMRALVAGVDSPGIREAQVRLGTALLWFFLPQVVLYAVGMIATGVLNSRGRFAVPVAAPIANNVVVMLALWMFWELRDGAPPSLDLSAAQTAVLGGGTTLGVLALSAIPVVALARSGFSLRPRFDVAHPEVRRIVAAGGWAALFVAAGQILLGVVLVLANAVEGGVVSYQVAYTLFLVPHALFALPVLTALFPTMARHASAGDRARFGGTVAAGVQAVAFLVLPAAAALAALAGPLSRVLLFGESSSGAAAVAGAVAAFAPGLIGYGAFLLLARALYALGDARTPAMVHLAVLAVAAGGMVVLAAAVPAAERVAALAAAHSVAYLAGAALLGARVYRHLPPAARPRLAGPVLRGAAAAACGGLVMWLVQQPLDPSGRLATVAVAVAAATAGTLVYAGAQALLGTRPSMVAALVRNSA